MPQDPPNRLDTTLRAIFSPVARLLIRYHVPFSHAAEALKSALVRNASDEGASDSLISLRTGLHRKDVKRLRQGQEPPQPRKSATSDVALVVSTWANAPAFADKSGVPRALPRRDDATGPGFDSLVRQCKVDLAPATMLAELIAQGLVETRADKALTLTGQTVIPKDGPAALDAFDATIADHLRVATDNTLAPPGQPRAFDQVLRYSHLSPASVATLEAEARTRARCYLEDLNAMAHRLQVADAETGATQTGRFVTGVYVAPTHPDETAPPEEPTDP